MQFSLKVIFEQIAIEKNVSRLRMCYLYWLSI